MQQQNGRQPEQEGHPDKLILLIRFTVINHRLVFCLPSYPRRFERRSGCRRLECITMPLFRQRKRFAQRLNQGSLFERKMITGGALRADSSAVYRLDNPVFRKRFSPKVYSRCFDERFCQKHLACPKSRIGFLVRSLHYRPEVSH